MKITNYSNTPKYLLNLTKGYALLIFIFICLSPAFAITYLYIFQVPELYFENYIVHEVVISISLLQSGFITYVTYQCYINSKELFLRWLTLGFLGVSIAYGFHGLSTRISHDHLILFALYGATSRLIIASCLFSGLILYGRKKQSSLQVPSKYFWFTWIGVFITINAFISILAFSEWAILANSVAEMMAMVIMFTCVLTIIMRGIRTHLMMTYTLSIIFFVQSSIAFMIGSAWSHMFWLAHGIFASGFIALSYGVIQAFLTTGSFSRVYSQTELIDQLRNQKKQTEDALLKLQRSYEALEIYAETDPLTGCANRRGFEKRAITEILRVERNCAFLSIITIDIDHFKRINDSYGHSGGDEVLRKFIALVKKTLLTIDLTGRIGGEEFCIILPDTSLENAAIVAERLRNLTEMEVVTISGNDIKFTISIGIAEYGVDGTTYEAIINVADSRMYRAKQAGRNRVIAQ